MIEILTEWIRIAKNHNMMDKVNQFWLLRDFAERRIWSEAFYRAHAQEAWEVLCGLDDSKPEVEMVLKKLLPIVKEYM